MSEIPIFIADAFVGALGKRVLRGNPAAVALLDAPRDAAWMQEVAAEMNLSETAFVVPKDDQNFDLRWFTPQCEVALCGHATLASAHILWDSGQLRVEADAHFHTLSGVLTARKRDEAIALDFPAQETVPCADLEGLADALGLDNRQILGCHRAADDFLIEIGSKIEDLAPDFERLRSIEARGIIVTAKASQNAPFDFLSRFFAPAVGINEDPVTGSAHTKLAPFWGARWGKTQMVGFQASPRGGLVRVDWRNERVELSGRARTRLRGQWQF